MPRKGIKMNKSVLQRGIIIILCSCILFSICPVYAFAAENQKEKVVRIGVSDLDFLQKMARRLWTLFPGPFQADLILFLWTS